LRKLRPKDGLLEEILDRNQKYSPCDNISSQRYSPEIRSKRVNDQDVGFYGGNHFQNN